MIIERFNQIFKKRVRQSSDIYYWEVTFLINSTINKYCFTANMESNILFTAEEVELIALQEEITENVQIFI